MKRALALVLLMSLLLVNLSACSSGVPQEEYDAVVSERDALQEENKALQEELDSLKSEYEDVVIDRNALLIMMDEEINSIEQEGSTGEIQVYSDEYVTIWYSHCEEDSSILSDERSVVLLTENKTAETLTLRVDTFAVDGWNLDNPLGFEDILPGSKGYLEIRSEDIPTLQPGKISGELSVYDAATIGAVVSSDVQFYDVSLQ